MTHLQPIISAVQDAVKLCRTIQAGGFDASSKGDDSPVTIADYGAQALICRAIQQHFPGDAIIGEEGGATFLKLVAADAQKQVTRLIGDILGESVSVEDVVGWLDYGRDIQAGRTWVIDPIDGTIGFVNKRYYAVVIGLLENGKPTQGVMGLPRSPIDANGSIVYADGGGSVQAMAMDGGDPRQVRASQRPPGDDLLFMDSVKLPAAEHALAARVREAAGLEDARVELYDSQLKYAMIAAGYADAFVRMPRDIRQEPHKIWDHAGGAALILAAGGKITDVAGAPLDFTQGEALPHYGFIASNGSEALHAAIVRGVRAVFGAAWGL